MVNHSLGSLAPKRTLLKALLFLLVFAALFFAFVPVNAQTTHKPVPSGKVFNLDTIKKKASEGIKTTNTAILNGVTYPVYATKSGKLFIKRISKKTGKEYRQTIKTEEK